MLVVKSLIVKLLIVDAPVRICDYKREAQGKKGRERLIKNLKKTIREYIEYLELSEDLMQN